MYGMEIDSVPLICHYNGAFKKVGGDMRIIYVSKTIEFPLFISKMYEVCDLPQTQETNLSIKCNFRLNDHDTVLVSVIDNASLRLVLAPYPNQSKAVVMYIIIDRVKVSKAETPRRMNIFKSAEDANGFNLKDFQDPLQLPLSTLELPSESPSHGNHERSDDDLYDGNGSNSQYKGRQRQQIYDPPRDLSNQVLEKFSLVTKFARETTTQLFHGSRGCISSANHRVNKFARETTSQLFPAGNHGDKYSAYERRRQLRHGRLSERRGIFTWDSLTFKRTKKNKKLY